MFVDEDIFYERIVEIEAVEVAPSYLRRVARVEAGIRNLKLEGQLARYVDEL